MTGLAVAGSGIRAGPSSTTPRHAGPPSAFDSCERGSERVGGAEGGGEGGGEGEGERREGGREREREREEG